MRHRLIGSVVGVGCASAVGAAMLPIRSHIAIATAALILVVPVVAGVAIGGWVAGLGSVVAGFLVYDLAFIPPYWRLTAGSGQNWLVLGVYVVVMIVVARVVAHQHDAQDAATSRARSARHLVDLSELLLTESPSLPQTVVTGVARAFAITSVALVEEREGALEIVASAGELLEESDLERLRAGRGQTFPLATVGGSEGLQTLALVSAGRPVGMLVLRGVPVDRAVRDALPVLANHLAIALERSRLAQIAHHAELLEEVDRLRQALLGAVSHDLRTPLATIKVASSTLAADDAALSGDDAHELHVLIDEQADRLARLVGNLLDLTRIESGALRVERVPVQLARVVHEALAALATAIDGREIVIVDEESMPIIDADPTLITQVLVNLLDNAHRHAPAGTPITVAARRARDGIEVEVADCGDGVPVAERESVFKTFVGFDTGGRAGLGLAIARAFVEAHGGRIFVTDAIGGGARFVFSAPAGSQDAVR